MKVRSAILVGLLVREAFSFWTGHPFDFELTVRLGYWMLHGSNPYGVLAEAPGLSFANVFSQYNSATIAYLPFWPFVTASIYLLYSLVGSGDRFVYYFLLKQPVVLGDVGLAYAVYEYTLRRGAERAEWALRLWLFMPFTIIVSSMWGTFDSLAMCFVVLSMSGASYLRRSAYEGLAILAKSIPVIFALPLLVRRPSRSWGLLVAAVIPLSVTALALGLYGWSFGITASTLLSTANKGGESMSFFDLLYLLNYAGLLPQQFPTYLLGLVWVPGVIITTLIAIKRFGLDTDQGIVQTMLAAALSFLILKAQVNEQYAIYLLALAMIDVSIWNTDRKRLLYWTFVISTLFLLTNNLLLIRFASPVFPEAVSIDNTLDAQLGLFRFVAKFILGSCFTVLNLLYIASVFRKTRWNVQR